MRNQEVDSMSYLMTIIAFAVLGFILLFFMAGLVFQDLTMDLLSGLLGAVVGVALALITGQKGMRRWSW
jgi:hypothetical protein